MKSQTSLSSLNAGHPLPEPLLRGGLSHAKLQRILAAFPLALLSAGDLCRAQTRCPSKSRLQGGTAREKNIPLQVFLASAPQQRALSIALLCPPTAKEHGEGGSCPAWDIPPVRGAAMWGLGRLQGH